MPDQYSWESFGHLIGVATRQSDSRSVTPEALNMDFRTGNFPRWGHMHMQEVFENSVDKELFQKGNVQKVKAYNAYGNRPAAIVYLIAGAVFVGTISGHWIYVKKVFDGLRPDLMVGWMCQGFEWFVVQNGKDNAIIWDGYKARQAVPDNAEMPVGGPMEFIHHSIAVCSTDGLDKIAVSDRWKPLHSDNLWHFRDTASWDDAGVFGLHANFGSIVALAVIPQIKQTPDGQGDLLICGTNGAQTLNLQIARNQLLNSQVQDTAIIGSGFASYLGVLPVNNSTYYISQNGLEEVRRRRTEFENSDALVTESGDIDLYWKNSNKVNRSFLALGHADNRLFMGVMPETLQSTKWGQHHFHNAWTTLDLAERYVSGQRVPRAWNGLQCGIRPIEWVSDVLVNRCHRSYVVSHDVDGINRTYEVTNYMQDDVVEGQTRPIKSFFVSPAMGRDAKGNITMDVKKPVAVAAEFGSAESTIKVSMSSRGDNSKCWNPWGSTVTRSSPDQVEDFKIPGVFGGRLPFSAAATCDETASGSFRVRIDMEGRADINAVRVKWKPAGGKEAGFRDSDCEKTIPGCLQDFGIYHIQP